MDLATLLVSIGITGDSEATRGVTNVNQAIQQGAKASQDGAKATDLYSSGLIGLAGSAQTALGSLGGLAGIGAAISGVNVAAQFEQLEGGLTTLLGNADKAHDMVEKLMKMGKSTPYNTGVLSGYARDLISVGDSADEALKHVRSFADLGAANHLPVDKLAGMVSVFSRMNTSRPIGVEGIAELAARGMNLQKVVNAGENRTGSLRFAEGKLGMAQASAHMGGMPGILASDILYKGMEKVYGGAAEKAAGNSWIGLMQNMKEGTSFVFKATGERLLNILEPLARGFLRVADFAEQINKWGKGLPGLVALGYGLYRGWSLLTTSIGGLIGSVRAASLALNGLAVRAATTGGGIGGTTIMPVGGGGSGASGLVPAAGAAASLGWMARLKGFLPGALGRFANFAKSGFGVGLAGMGLGYIGERIGGGFGNTVSNIGSGVTFGAMLGSIVPGIGTAVGAAVGGALGLAKGGYEWYESSHRGSDKMSSAEAKIVENTKRSADSLESLSGMLIGGGERSRRVTGQMEVEISLARVLQMGGA